MGIFPAGKVATKKDPAKKFPVDEEWNHKMLGLLSREKVPIIPVYFHAKNSRFFYLISKISPALQTLRLTAEAFSQHKRRIQVRVGNLIRARDLNPNDSDRTLSKFLRAKTFVLSRSFNPKKNDLRSRLPKIIRPKKIIDQVDINLLDRDIHMLRNENCKLLDQRDFEIFFTTADLIPNLLREIGRLREISFREIGEGTDQEIDLDRYDKFYRHLILWDNFQKKIAGAYRIGFGGEIISAYGIDGLYISSLFNIDAAVGSILRKTIEMGRAFIVKEYQNHPLSLHLLWKGIVHMTIRNPEYKYLIGGVSISDEYSHMSKSLIIDYMSSNFYDQKIAQYFHPKSAFKIEICDDEVNLIYKECKEYQQNFISIDKLINDIEPKNLRVPVLIKKYLKQNATVIGFNRDRSFNNVIDALLFIAIKDLPESTTKPVLKEYGMAEP